MQEKLIDIVRQVAKEKNISAEVIIEALEASLIMAYKRNFGSANNIRVVNSDGDWHIFVTKVVVEEVIDSKFEIDLVSAKKINDKFELDDEIDLEVTPKDFGRIAAQTAKQVIIQRLRDAERNVIYDEYTDRENDILSGKISRVDQKNVHIDLGRTEAVLAPSEQIPGERYVLGERIKAYVLEVRKVSKGPQIMVSRTHPGLLKRLLELEVPEIKEGIVEIKAISREPGSRSKVAVFSRNPEVDSVGACIGHKGSRVQMIVNELHGEKMDVIRWSEDAAEYIAGALSPAKVISVDVNLAEKTSRVVVPDFQLSLAIGKEGQNARLAAKLTGWKIDIKSESQV
ncbi:MAG: transcription termination factor NusA [Negativicutes bacterium]